MADTWSVDRLLNLACRLSRHLRPLREADHDAADLYATLTRLTHSLHQILRSYPATGSLLWIDDVGASLHAASRHLHTAQVSRAHSLRSNNPLPQSRHRKRLSLAKIFSTNSSRNSTNLPILPSDPTLSKPSPSSIDRFRHSFSRLLFNPTPKSVNINSPFKIAARLADEWIVAVRSSTDPPSPDEVDSWLSLSDALPPQPRQNVACQHPIYFHLAHVVETVVAQPSPVHDDRQIAKSIALLAPDGAGKTSLAVQLVHDYDSISSFADGVAWLQLGANIAEEELIDQLIRCVDSLIAEDFRNTIRYCCSFAEVLARAGRLLSHVSTLFVVDDVVGHVGKHALEAIITALGPSSVVLYTAPYDIDDDPESFINTSCVSKIIVPPLQPHLPESALIFREWLTKSLAASSSSAYFAYATQQDAIIKACHGLPLALAMSAGLLSRFPTDWALLADELETSKSGDDTVFRILNMLTAKGKERFKRQLRDVACLPQGVWISLSALADLWGVDYRSVKESARRMGRIAFADYRLGDTSDDSRVRFNSHVYRFCQRLASEEDIMASHRKLLTNMRERRPRAFQQRVKTHFMPWWTACLADAYTCRRLHWHISKAEKFDELRELLCDYDWLCQRLQLHGLHGVLFEFSAALDEEEQFGTCAEANGIKAIYEAIQDAARLRKEDALQLSAFPTFIVSRLYQYECSSLYCRELLSSTYDKARRPWLRPIPPAEPPVSSSVTNSASSISEESEDNVHQSLCLVSSYSGKVVSGDRNGNIQVYDPATGKNIVCWSSSALIGDDRERGVTALGTVQEFVISGHVNGKLFLRSMRTGEIELIQESTKTKQRITALATTDDGIVAVGNEAGKMYILKNVNEFGSKVVRVELDGHCDTISTLHVLPGGNRVASSSYKGFATIWNVDDPRRDGGHVSLNGHRPSSGHRENYITTFATLAGGKRLLSSCRAGIVNAWDTSNGACLWRQDYGYEFSSSVALQAFGIRHFACGFREGRKAIRLLKVGYPYMITRGESNRDLLIVTAGNCQEVMAVITSEQGITSWLEVWHAATQRIYVAVSHSDGRLSSYELVTALK